MYGSRYAFQYLNVVKFRSGGYRSLLSSEYVVRARPICFRLLMQAEALARSRALAKTGNRMAARMAMMAMTTSNSIRVKPRTFSFMTGSLQVFPLRPPSRNCDRRKSFHLTACADHAGVPVRAILRRSLLAGIVHVDDTEPFRVAESPLEVVHQRPDE